MNTYKLIFAKNDIITCELLAYKVDFKGEYYYEQDKGQLIYALVRAGGEAEAIGKGHDIVKEVIEKTFGKDFVN